MDRFSLISSPASMDSELTLQKLEPERKVGLVKVITGHGKGKTTSALGIILRSVGYDMRVCLFQFMKGGMFAGEYEGSKRLATQVEHHLTGKGFWQHLYALDLSLRQHLL